MKKPPPLPHHNCRLWRRTVVNLIDIVGVPAEKPASFDNDEWNELMHLWGLRQANNPTSRIEPSTERSKP